MAALFRLIVVSLIVAKANVKFGDIFVVRVKPVCLGLVVDLMIERSDHRTQSKFRKVGQWRPEYTQDGNFNTLKSSLA